MSKLIYLIDLKIVISILPLQIYFSIFVFATKVIAVWKETSVG